MIQLVMNSKLDINSASGIRKRLPKEKHLRLTSLFFVGNTERLYRSSVVNICPHECVDTEYEDGGEETVLCLIYFRTLTQNSSRDTESLSSLKSPRILYN